MYIDPLSNKWGDGLCLGVCPCSLCLPRTPDASCLRTGGVAFRFRASDSQHPIPTRYPRPTSMHHEVLVRVQPFHTPRRMSHRMRPNRYRWTVQLNRQCEIQSFVQRGIYRCTPQRVSTNDPIAVHRSSNPRIVLPHPPQPAQMNPVVPPHLSQPTRVHPCPSFPLPGIVQHRQLPDHCHIAHRVHQKRLLNHWHRDCIRAREGGPVVVEHLLVEGVQCGERARMVVPLLNTVHPLLVHRLHIDPLVRRIHDKGELVSAAQHRVLVQGRHRDPSPVEKRHHVPDTRFDPFGQHWVDQHRFHYTAKGCVLVNRCRKRRIHRSINTPQVNLQRHQTVFPKHTLNPLPCRVHPYPKVVNGNRQPLGYPCVETGRDQRFGHRKRPVRGHMLWPFLTISIPVHIQPIRNR